MNLDNAKLAYRAAKAVYLAEWVRGESPALAAAEARKDAAWADLCNAQRNSRFLYEEGAYAAQQQLQALALDDA